MATPLQNLEYIFNPRSVAFVGATEAKVKWGFIIFNNIVSAGFEGALYPVNPGHEKIMGMDCYPSVRDIPGEVDLAVFTVPARGVLSGMRDCAGVGVKAALVISAGFKELGEEGARLEAEMVRTAEEAGIILVGPNGQGVCCPKNSFYCWMPLFYPPDGRVAFVCQSGNILNMFIGQALDSGFGVSKAVSSGNEAQLKTEDYCEYLAGDPDTDVTACYVEGVEDGRRFLRLMREAAQRKPIVLLKGGRTGSGVRAARSHTGAIAVAADIFEAACAQAGVTVTGTIEEAGIIASSFLNRPLPRGRRVGIVTGGGGLGVIAADACADNGLEVVKLSDGTLDRIAALLPDYWVPGNPIDLVAGLDLTIIMPVLDSLMGSGEVDAVLFIFIESQRTRGTNLQDDGGQGYDLMELWDMMTKRLGGYLDDLYAISRDSGVPLYVASNFNVSENEDAGAAARPMIYGDVEAACSAIGAMARRFEHLQRMPRTPLSTVALSADFSPRSRAEAPAQTSTVALSADFSPRSGAEAPAQTETEED